MPTFIRSLALAAIALAIGSAMAQSTPDPRTLGVIFVEEPLRIDEVGLTMPLPEGSIVQAAQAGSSAAAQVTDASGAWVLGISTPRAVADGQTATSFADRIIEQVRQNFAEVRVNAQGLEEAGPTRAQLIGRTSNLEVSGFAADRFAFRLPSVEIGGQDIIKSYTVVHPGGRQFIVFEMSARPNDAPIATRITETMIAACEIVDPAKLMLDRGKAVERGLLVLSGMTLSDINELATAEEAGRGRWERLFRPGPSGDPLDDEELGYRRLQFRRGMRGELDRSRNPGSFTGIEREEGLLVWMEARLLRPDEVVIDTAAEFFVSEDGSREFWNIRMTPRRNGTPTGTYTELGVRDRTELEVTVESPGELGRKVRPLIQGPGYLSQAQTALLGNLLARTKLEGEFGFYTYRSADQRIRFRRDRVTRMDGPVERWKVSTVLAEGMEPQVSIYDEQGRFVRTDLDNGTRWERTSIEQLARLWRAKGLPLN